MDVKIAFLNGNIEKEICMVQPKSFKASFIIFGLQIKKSIYGINQASRQWYLKSDHVISDFGFKEIVDDQCIYHKFKESRLIFLVLYIDDILLASNDMTLLLETKSFLMPHFPIYMKT